MIPKDENKLTIAIPNKGRLNEPTIELLKNAGYKFRVKDRTLYSTCTNANMQILFLRAKDIPFLIDSGVVDLGITGQDLIVEDGVENVVELMPLNYGRCRLCVAVKDEFNEDNLKSLEGKKIATSFPKITKDYFKREGVDIKCIEMSGSLEIMVGLKLAEAIVDIVETGDTLRDNNLKVFSEIGKYQTALFAHKDSVNHEDIEKIKRRLMGVVMAKKFSLLEYNIKKDLIKDAEKITPGVESPTVSPLDEEGWAAVEVMVEKSMIVDAMDKLAELGATGIIETEIKNCRL